jgi:predicted alpha/beta-hydrolase family hydrolase
VNGLVFLGYPLHPPGKHQQLRDEHLYGLTLPMLFISGTRDTFAARDLLEGVVGKIGPNATLMWIEGGDHSLKRGRKDDDSWRTAANAVTAWVQNLK